VLTTRPWRVEGRELLDGQEGRRLILSAIIEAPRAEMYICILGHTQLLRAAHTPGCQTGTAKICVIFMDVIHVKQILFRINRGLQLNAVTAGAGSSRTCVWSENQPYN